MMAIVNTAFSQAPGQNGLAVKPVTLSFSTNSGGTETQSVAIVNGLKTKKQFRLYLNDWRRDSTGAHVYMRAGSDKRSCAQWVSIDKTFLEIDSNEVQNINVKIAIPDSIPSLQEMKWCMLFLETVQEQKVTNGKGMVTTVANKFRFGVHIYLVPPAVNAKAVRLISFREMQDTARKFRITCENAGAVQLNCTSYLELSSISDGSRIRVPVKDFPLFPEQKRIVDFILPPDIPKGKYLLTGVVDAGNDTSLEAAQLTIEVR